MNPYAAELDWLLATEVNVLKVRRTFATTERGDLALVFSRLVGKIQAPISEWSYAIELDGKKIDAPRTLALATEFLL